MTPSLEMYVGYAYTDVKYPSISDTISYSSYTVMMNVQYSHNSSQELWKKSETYAEQSLPEIWLIPLERKPSRHRPRAFQRVSPPLPTCWHRVFCHNPLESSHFFISSSFQLCYALQPETRTPMGPWCKQKAYTFYSSRPLQLALYHLLPIYIPWLPCSSHISYITRNLHDIFYHC